jgi:uncharacterized membrane protein
MRIANAGSACLGGVIGYLVIFFVTRFDTYSPKVLSALIGAILGSAVIGFLTKLSGYKDAIWYYPVGLAIGVVVGIILYWIRHGSPPIMQHIGLALPEILPTSIIRFF